MFLPAISGISIGKNNHVCHSPFLRQIGSRRVHDHAIVKSAVARLQRHCQPGQAAFRRVLSDLPHGREAEAREEHVRCR